MANNERNFDELVKKLRTDHQELLRSKLSPKERVLYRLYDLANFLADNVDMDDVAQLRVIADTIEFIKTNCKG